MSKRPTFEMITKTATAADPRWSAKDKCLFHYFNPNGLCAAKRANDDRITALVEAGKCASGAILAYGSFDHYHTDQFANTCGHKRISPATLVVMISGLKSQMARAEKFITETTAKE